MNSGASPAGVIRTAVRGIIKTQEQVDQMCLSYSLSIYILSYKRLCEGMAEKFENVKILA